MGRLNVIRDVGNSCLGIEVMRASTYSTYDVGKRYDTTRSGRGLVSMCGGSNLTYRMKDRIVVDKTASLKVETMV